VLDFVTDGLVLVTCRHVKHTFHSESARQYLPMYAAVVTVTPNGFVVLES